MLTPQDDLIGHQLPTTFDHVCSSDPAWMERLWYTGHPVQTGDTIFDIGLGYHPNRNVMDGFAGVTVGDMQHNFRVSRRARPNPLETVIGPLRISVIEGLRRISRPGLRQYVGATQIPRVLGGLGIAVVSTPEGVMSGNQARKKNLGGEVLCYVW